MQTEIKYPLNDLKREYFEMNSEIDEAILRVIESQHFILGPEVENFEIALADYCEVKHAIAVSSGTDALLASLMAINIKPGDEVIVPAYSFIATASCISRLGATPVFVDIKPDTYNINVDYIESVITPRTRAIIPVHFAGQMADMDKIMRLATSYDLIVIEDACQAIGATHFGKMAGSIGLMGCFSFFPTKNLGGYGDGGAVVTNDDMFDQKLRMLRNHGQRLKYYSQILGGNFRMDEIQAAVLSTKLKYLDIWNGWRRWNAGTYGEALEDSGLVFPNQLLGNKHVYHLFVVRAKDTARRSAIIQYLRDHGVETGIYYPLSLPEQWIFPHAPDAYPIAKMASRTTLALPIRPYPFTRQIRTICKTIKECP